MINIIFRGGPHNGREHQIPGKSWSIDIVNYLGDKTVSVDRYIYSKRIPNSRIAIFIFDKTY